MTAATHHDDTATEPACLRMWREDDPVALGIPGMELDPLPIGASTAETAAEAHRRGARRVLVAPPVTLRPDTSAAATVHALTLIRDLTSWGLAVDWQLEIGVSEPEKWRSLRHLYPPTTLTGPAEADAALAQWSANFFVGMCTYRQGPGFIQVRDHRSGPLRRYTLDDAPHREAMHSVLHGDTRDSLPAEAYANFVAADLIGAVGDLVWWLPYRVRRWPHPAMLV
jgi:hypothetical protein